MDRFEQCHIRIHGMLSLLRPFDVLSKKIHGCPESQLIEARSHAHGVLGSFAGDVRSCDAFDKNSRNKGERPGDDSIDDAQWRSIQEEEISYWRVGPVEARRTPQSAPGADYPEAAGTPLQTREY
jgi:hypothetical protein